ncbi:hypothetical protein AB0B50_01635 [Streptomyces sp. NPDC041068]|uniref:hypothetical protein n=1 Tax=Streptomyces sp. NPDC041068 TaxID=3155130 RepID=UPI0033EF495B
MEALAAAGGGAVVGAAGSDAWDAIRLAVARWFGRGDAERERAELVRLDQTAAELDGADLADAERARIGHTAAWRTRFAVLLEGLPEHERLVAADELRALVTAWPGGDTSAVTGDSGVAVGRDATNRAEHGSVAATVIHGGVRLEHPSKPDPTQG